MVKITYMPTFIDTDLTFVLLGEKNTWLVKLTQTGDMACRPK